MADPFMLNRIDVIIETGIDAFPDTCSSAILETALKRLVDGGVAKYAGLEELNTGVRGAIAQLFTMRDAGRFGGEHGMGNHPADRR